MAIVLANEMSCTGCTACAHICPYSCIEMKDNIEGFLYPIIDKNLCVECGLCEKTCPVLEKPVKDKVITNAYAAYSKDESIRLLSSSGGIFSLLASVVLEKGGVVYGAAFDVHFKVHHIGIETKEELNQLRGSKYVQSDLENIFLHVKDALDHGRIVLFSGVICQIAGLLAFLKQDYPNLLTVDVLCHGVPSPKLWRKYMDKQVKLHGAPLKRMFFRNKKYGWKTYAVSLEFTNDTAYESVFHQDPFMQMFLRDICLRRSCHACHFNEIDRLSDMTLGDCWGIENIMPDMDDDKGTSVLIVHSIKGNEYFNSIKENIVYRQAEVNSILPPSSGGRKSFLPHPKREQMFKMLKDGASFSELSRLVKIPIGKKILNTCRRIAGKGMRKLKIN